MGQRGRQLELGLTKGRHGGWRPGAGRRRTGRAGVGHDTRPFLDGRHPVHVTWRVGREIPNLRRWQVYDVLRRAFRDGGDRHGLRLCHYSVQHNHVHLICEAANRRALTRGLQGLGIRIARGLNRKLERRGRVLTDRFHARALGTPLEVKNALLYVLNNHRRHGETKFTCEIDERSSAYAFDGWRERIGTPCRDGPPPVCLPETWLLTAGWRKRGLLGLRDVPPAAVNRRSPRSGSSVSAGGGE